jgi:K+-sensing histidine kinase KdpD
MLPKTQDLRETLFARADPVVFRIAAYIAAIGVAGSDMLLAGAWWAILAVTGLVAAACFIFPARAPQDEFRKKILAALRIVRFSCVWMRLGCAIFLILIVSVLDYYVRFELGREFNIFLLPIFLVSLLFGLPLAILTWLLSFIVVYFNVIPPRYSFEITELKEFAELFGFFYLGLMTLTVPVLIRASAAVDE